MSVNNNYLRGDENRKVPAHLNFGKHMLHFLKQMGDKVALVNATTGEELTYKNLVQRSVNMASALLELGIGKGDVVAYGSEKCINFIPNVLGVIFTGAACTPYDLTSGEAALRHKILIAKPSYFICSKLFLKRCEEVLQSYDFIKACLTLDENVKVSSKIQFIRLSGNVDVAKFKPTNVLGQIDTALILYSSGTTGMRKGVRITHLNWIINTLPDNFKDKSIQTVYIFAEWYNNYDIFMTYTMLSGGKKMVYVNDVTPTNVLECLEKYQVNLAMIDPYLVSMISKEDNIQKYNLDSLKVIYSATSLLHGKTIETLMSRLPKLHNIFQGYGMTESGELTSDCYALKGPKWGSVGMASSGVLIKIVDPKTGKILGPNETGEIRIIGSFYMEKAYIDIDPATYLDEEGFFKTGDLGYFDEDKYLYVTGRIKDIIIHQGYKVVPLELEAILETHPAVLEAGVIGTPDSQSEELPTAFVVKKPNSDVTEEELTNLVSKQADSYMQLTGGIKFIKFLPRNARGKILHQQLRELLNC